MKYYFYCPRCGFDEYINSIPNGAVGNIRDGWGIPIYHFCCPKCSNLDAGAMRVRYDDLEERKYYQIVINKYQGIRTPYPLVQEENI